MTQKSMKATVGGRIKEMGTRLQKLLERLPDNDATTDTLDYVLGALYALDRANRIGFVDRPGPSHPTYRAYLTNYTLDIVGGNMDHELWFGGFYFNCAIQRLAASYDRIPGLLGAGEGKAWERMKSIRGSVGRDWYLVYREVNDLKHDPKGRAEGRRVTFESALNAVEELLELVEAKAEGLTRKRTEDS